MFKELMRAIVVAFKVTRDVVQGASIGLKMGLSGQRLPRQGIVKEIKGIGADVSNYWHSTLRSKDYVRPSEMSASDIAQYQADKRANYNPSEVHVVNRPVRQVEVDRRMTPQPQVQPTVSQAPKYN